MNATTPTPVEIYARVDYVTKHMRDDVGFDIENYLIRRATPDTHTLVSGEVKWLDPANATIITEHDQWLIEAGMLIAHTQVRCYFTR